MLEFLPPTDADHGWLYDLHRAAMGPYVDAIWGWEGNLQQQLFREHLATGVHAIMLVDGERVGAIQYLDEADHIFLGQIEVLSASQGRGFGSAAIRKLQDMARTSLRPVRLRVLKINDRALALYRRLHFTVIGETERHFVMSSHAD